MPLHIFTLANVNILIAYSEVLSVRVFFFARCNCFDKQRHLLIFSYFRYIFYNSWFFIHMIDEVKILGVTIKFIKATITQMYLKLLCNDFIKLSALVYVSVLEI